MNDKRLYDALDFLGNMVAFLTIVLEVVLIVNANISFIPADVLSVLMTISRFTGITLLGIVGYEAVAEKHFIIKVVVLVLFGIILLNMFAPHLITSAFAFFIK